MPTVATSTTALGVAIPANTNRISLSIKNIDGTNTIYFINNLQRPGTTVTTGNADFRLAPGEPYNANRKLNGLMATTASFQAIAGGGTPSFTYTESWLMPGEVYTA